MPYIYNRILGDFRPTGIPLMRSVDGVPASFRDFNIRPISKEWRLFDETGRKPGYRTAVANAAYIWRDSTPVDEIGAMPAMFSERRFEILKCGLMLPASAPNWACSDYTIWQEADLAVAITGNVTEVSAWHVMMRLPLNLRYQWTSLVRDFVQTQLVNRGAVVAWSIHSLEAADGTWIVHPHVHLVVIPRTFAPTWRRWSLRL